MAFLEVRKLIKSFDSLPVLRDVSFTVDQGDVIAIIGASGSGKSTLLRCLIDLETVDGGWVTIGGEPLIAGGKYPDPRTRRALQVILESGVYEMHHRLSEFGNKGGEGPC